ncbi:hypothetical protein B0T14DRAFT_499946 [Immersiella caudata]|uniref:Heterokaryon incompatibility domain-containing protein n=1 Tax=Immersiella caudata TaxID=314043 RepID=A0AA39WG36_9PEZI|nr:hypothetical protein B0T14DRAFT_499946 [Immersiella caudata]
MHVPFLAAKLEIPYVWIDSLCIIQRDVEGWDMEAVRIADYYQRSVFTIASPEAGHGIGLFGRVVDSPSPLIRIPYREKSGQERGYFNLSQTETNVAGRFYNAITSSDMLARGWVFQEWILSRRIVCFTTTGLFLLSSAMSPQTQDGEVVIPESATKMFNYSMKNTLVEFDLSVPNSLEGDMPSEGRLAAIGGIADEFGRVLAKRFSVGKESDDDDDDDDTSTASLRTYVAGIWLSTIHNGLLWEQATKGIHQRLAGIPTWSWASVYTQVNAGLIDADPPLSLAEGPLEVLPGNRARGPIKDNPRKRFPVLCLRGKLQSVSLGGYLAWSHVVYNVLFVRAAQTIANGYERVGVGRLFGQDIEKGIGEAVMKMVRLVYKLSLSPHVPYHTKP